jgi:hypothetical protein
MTKIILASFLFASSAAFSATPVLTNGSFETNNLSTPPFYAYGAAAVASGWSFNSNAGLSQNYTAWGGVTPSGNSFAFLQNANSTFSQTFSASSSYTYGISFEIAQRSYGIPGTPAAYQTVNVLLDGNLLVSGVTGTAGTSWSTITATPITLAAGSHTLTFIGLNPAAAIDTSAFIDNVQMTAVSAVPEASTYIMMITGLGFIAAIARQRKRSV